jgi:hypothetical protein
VGLVLQLTNGPSSDTAAPAFDAFAFGRTLGIPIRAAALAGEEAA